MVLLIEVGLLNLLLDDVRRDDVNDHEQKREKEYDKENLILEIKPRRNNKEIRLA